MKKEAYPIQCPTCGSETRVKVFEDTVLVNFPLACAHCKNETVINVVKLKIVPADTINK